MLTVYVHQTFDIKQDSMQEALENLKKIQKYRTENHNQKVEILVPISGKDHTYSLLATFEGLAEMEMQNKKMFDDEEYVELIKPFFLEHIVQGSMYTQVLRALTP